MSHCLKCSVAVEKITSLLGNEGGVEKRTSAALSKEVLDQSTSYPLGPKNPTLFTPVLIRRLI
jgi:hypothetical protein